MAFLHVLQQRLTAFLRASHSPHAVNDVGECVADGRSNVANDFVAKLAIIVSAEKLVEDLMLFLPCCEAFGQRFLPVIGNVGVVEHITVVVELLGKHQLAGIRHLLTLGFGQTFEGLGEQGLAGDEVTMQHHLSVTKAADVVGDVFGIELNQTGLHGSTARGKFEGFLEILLRDVGRFGDGLRDIEHGQLRHSLVHAAAFGDVFCQTADPRSEFGVLVIHRILEGLRRFCEVREAESWHTLLVCLSAVVNSKQVTRRHSPLGFRLFVGLDRRETDSSVSTTNPNCAVFLF